MKEQVPLEWSQPASLSCGLVESETLHFLRRHLNDGFLDMAMRVFLLDITEQTDRIKEGLEVFTGLKWDQMWHHLSTPFTCVEEPEETNQGSAPWARWKFLTGQGKA